jgi:death on curing protein
LPTWDTIDEGKLLSALATPRPVFGHDKYPTLAEKAAVLLYSIAKAHALPNGNKRLAMTTTFLFLARNGHWWEAADEEIRAHVTWLAASEPRLRDEALAYMSRYFEMRLALLNEAT